MPGDTAAAQAAACRRLRGRDRAAAQLHIMKEK